MKASRDFRKFLPGIKFNIPLKNHTTFKIGGPAKYFFEAKSKEDLIEAIRFVQSKGLPFFILGGGSNLLVSDEGYGGLVIKIDAEGVTLRSEATKGLRTTGSFGLQLQDDRFAVIYTGAGTELKTIVELSLKNNLTGLEWAAGIPQATIGGALYGNAGAFGSSIGDVVEKVEVLDCEETRSPQVKILGKKDCQFDYKETIFKKNKNLIILSCLLNLKKGNKKEIEEKVRYFSDYRRKNHPMEFPSAGSVFKNFTPDISVGELIEKCGLKGKKIGGAMVSKKHANFIVNLGGARAKDVLRLINLIKNKVKEKFGIKLEEEIQIL